MQINLNNPNELSPDSVRELIASENDNINLQLRVSKEGFAFLSRDTGGEHLDGVLFRFETFFAGNEYVGIKASEDTEFINRLYEAIKKNWENPGATYIDNF